MPRWPLLTIAAAAAGCAAPGGDFPSLAPRAIEARSDAVASPARATAGPDAAAAARADALGREVAAAGAAFDRALPTAERRAAAAGASGSESWIAAQLALNALVRERARVIEALGELDRLLVAEYAADRPVAPATAALVERTRARAARQAALVDTLSRRLGD